MLEYHDITYKQFFTEFYWEKDSVTFKDQQRSIQYKLAKQFKVKKMEKVMCDIYDEEAKLQNNNFMLAIIYIFVSI